MKANLKKFSELYNQRRELEDRLKAVKQGLSELETVLLDEFESMGINSVNIDGQTVYVHRQLWAKAADGDYERACQALKQAGLEDLVSERFNTNTLSAYIRELEKTGFAIPPALEGAIDVAEVYSIRSRRG